MPWENKNHLNEQLDPESFEKKTNQERLGVHKEASFAEIETAFCEKKAVLLKLGQCSDKKTAKIRDRILCLLIEAYYKLINPFKEYYKKRLNLKEITSISSSSDHKCLIITDGTKLYILESISGNLLETIEPHFRLYQGEMSAKNQLVVYYGLGESREKGPGGVGNPLPYDVIIEDMKTSKRINLWAFFPKNEDIIISQIKISPNGKYLAIIGNGYALYSLDTKHFIIPWNKLNTPENNINTSNEPDIWIQDLFFTQCENLDVLTVIRNDYLVKDVPIPQDIEIEEKRQEAPPKVDQKLAELSSKNFKSIKTEKLREIFDLYKKNSFKLSFFCGEYARYGHSQTINKLYTYLENVENQKTETILYTQLEAVIKKANEPARIERFQAQNTLPALTTTDQILDAIKAAFTETPSLLSLAEKRDIDFLIRDLTEEKNSWYQLKSTLKQQKINALLQLKMASNERTIQETIKDVMDEFPQAASGRTSRVSQFLAKLIKRDSSDQQGLQPPSF